MTGVLPGEGIADAALERYQSAEERAVAAREEWEAEGSHFTIVYANGLEGVHPLLKAVQDAEAHADRLMKSLGRRALMGRPEGAASAPDRKAKLRRVS